MRLCITGGPRTGKSECTRKLPAELGPVRHTDDLIDRSDRDNWSKASALAAAWFDDPGPWVVEGVAVPRALRKWLLAHPEGKPCDAVVVFDRPLVQVTRAQEALGKGTMTVLHEIQAELEARGVRVTVEDVRAFAR